MSPLERIAKGGTPVCTGYRGNCALLRVVPREAVDQLLENSRPRANPPAEEGHQDAEAGDPPQDEQHAKDLEG